MNYGEEIEGACKQAMSDQTLALIVALVAVVGSVLTSVVTAVFAYRSTRLAKEAEERIANKAQILDAAYKNWERYFGYLTSIPDGKARGLQPLGEYIIITSKYVSLLDSDLTPDQLTERMKELADIQVALEEHQRQLGKRLSSSKNDPSLAAPFDSSDPNFRRTGGKK